MSPLKEKKLSVSINFFSASPPCDLVRDAYKVECRLLLAVIHLIVNYSLQRRLFGGREKNTINNKHEILILLIFADSCNIIIIKYQRSLFVECAVCSVTLVLHCEQMY